MKVELYHILKEPYYQWNQEQLVPLKWSWFNNMVAYEQFYRWQIVFFYNSLSCHCTQ